MIPLNAKILTEDHEKFDDFMDKLYVACKFRGDSIKTFKWECDHTTNKAKTILSEYIDIDIDGTLDHLRSKGGHCDCEIIFNCDKKETTNE